MTTGNAGFIYNSAGISDLWAYIKTKPNGDRWPIIMAMAATNLV
jgi:hypothetical protein